MSMIQELWDHFLAERNYEVMEWQAGATLFVHEHRAAALCILEMLMEFRFTRSQLLAEKRRSKTPMAAFLESGLRDRGLPPKAFGLAYGPDGLGLQRTTHKVDGFYERLAVEVEWNANHTAFDRDLNTFRLLHADQHISLGVIITRAESLKSLFARLGRADTYASSTHLGTLLPKLQSGGSGGSPVLAFGITEKLYVED